VPLSIVLLGTMVVRIALALAVALALALDLG
jgi:hypothetical protein